MNQIPESGKTFQEDTHDGSALGDSNRNKPPKGRQDETCLKLSDIFMAILELEW